MNLVEKLSNERKNMNFIAINAVVKNILALTEASIKADKKSLHIKFRLYFDDPGNKLTVCVNDREIDTIDISSLLGEPIEKLISLLNELSSEGFVDTTHTIPEYWGSDCTDKKILSIGFDI